MKDTVSSLKINLMILALVRDINNTFWLGFTDDCTRDREKCSYLFSGITWSSLLRIRLNKITELNFYGIT